MPDETAVKLCRVEFYVSSAMLNCVALVFTTNAGYTIFSNFVAEAVHNADKLLAFEQNLLFKRLSRKHVRDKIYRPKLHESVVKSN